MNLSVCISIVSESMCPAPLPPSGEPKSQEGAILPGTGSKTGFEDVCDTHANGDEWSHDLTGFEVRDSPDVE